MPIAHVNNNRQARVCTRAVHEEKLFEFKLDLKHFIIHLTI